MQGESVLNDAVAMVLYDTVDNFMQPGATVTAASIMLGAWRWGLVAAG